MFMARSITALYLEDSAEDSFLFQRALQKISFPGRLIVLADGVEGQNYILGQGEYADRASWPLPDLIISDVKLPNLSGLEFVKWLRTQEEFRSVPVLIFSSSDVLRDVKQAQEAGANHFFIKPFHKDTWEGVAAKMLDYYATLRSPSAE
jgi:CheY-like chemotaxis protein